MFDFKSKKNIKVKIRLANSEDIKGWANGEITESETLNYRTLKPVQGGLFCSQVFGPVNDYECNCSRYKGYKYDGIVCEKCNTQVTTSDVRRERMGYISLPVPVVHPWFFRKNNKIAALLNISLKDLKKISNLERYVVLHSGKTDLKKMDLISVNEFENNIAVEGFVAETGGTVLKQLLEEIDLEEMVEESKEIMKKNNSLITKKKCSHIIEICNEMIGSGVRPEYMIIDTIAIIPPDLRPLMEIEGGKFVSADINDLYRMCIYRIKRLKSLIENQITLPLILHNEIRILQDGINRLFGSGADAETKDITKKSKSLEDRIKGKDGNFRKSILGKRVDFSGRSPIVIAPELPLDYCYIPKLMALECLKPLINGNLRLNGFCSTIKQAKRMIENKRPEVWEILKEVSKTQMPFVLLNRAPTLHRVGIMGFKYKLWDKKCIGINPLVCKAFNADFDGDQMAVHFPLSQEAIAETLLMMPSNNMGSATNGSLLVMVTKDIILGIYAMTLSTVDKEDDAYYNNLPIVTSLAELDTIILSKKSTINDFIKYYDRDTKSLYITTPGRIYLWNIVPKHDNILFIEIDKAMASKDVHELMKKVRRFCGEDKLSKFADDIKELGFKYGNYYTGSIGKDDFFNIPDADKEINKAIQQQINLNILLGDGLITHSEITKKSDDIWKEVSRIGKNFVSEKITENRFNPLSLITSSGARGSINQLMQILFMKGNVTDISGAFSAIPIWNGHKKGLTMSEYFLLSYGARKGVADVALKTAEAGYFTRRLVDVAHACVVNEEDCNTKDFLTVRNIFKKGVLQNTVFDQILKRTAALDIKNPSTGELLITKNSLIDDDLIEILTKNDITEVPIRSPALCKLDKGICVKCYGGDISTANSFVCQGEAVGVIAAQSIGEPGTQLTMGSFHSGGVAKFGAQKESVVSPFKGKISFDKIVIVENSEGSKINISREGKIYVKNQHNLIVADFTIPYGADIVIKDKENILENTTLAKWLLETPIIAGFDGQIELLNIQKGINCEYITDEVTNKKNLIITKNKDSPSLSLKTKDGHEINYFLPINTILNFEDKSRIKRGDKIAYTLQSKVLVDIVGSLQKVINILENRMPVQVGILSKWKGKVKIQTDKKGKTVLNVTDSENEEREIFIGDLELVVQNDQEISEGDAITIGTPTMQDVLETRGLHSLIEHFISELQSIYMENGLMINNKHLEIILSQMCRRFEITADHGDLIKGKVIDKIYLNQMNKELIDQHKQKIEAKQLISGITNSALESTSFLSSASFQETISVLTNSGIMGAEDDLSSIKASIIAGSLIRAGTGFAFDQFKKMASILMEEETQESKKTTT